MNHRLQHPITPPRTIFPERYTARLHSPNFPAALSRNSGRTWASSRPNADSRSGKPGSQSRRVGCGRRSRPGSINLQQQFPAIGREWFLPIRPVRNRSPLASVPNVFSSRSPADRLLHLKAEWALALVTRCFEHQLPLYRYCPWCGPGSARPFSRQYHRPMPLLRTSLTIRRWTRTPASREPLIAAFERAVVEALAGRLPIRCGPANLPRDPFAPS